MAERTTIEWAEVTWNPLVGCSVVSPGCTNCYAMREAGGRLASSPKYRGLTLGSAGNSAKGGPVWTGEVRLWGPAFHADFLFSPQPKRVFVNSMSDLFHELAPDEWIDRILGAAVLCHWHTFLVLTKRAGRMFAWATRERARSAPVECLAELYVNHPELAGGWPLDADRAIDVAIRGWPLPNVWMGVSVEDRARLARVDDLRATPAALRFLSLEPLLEDLGQIDLCGIDWVIVGGESGPRARPMHPDWARSLRDQCAAAGVPFFFKQWGEWQPCGWLTGHVESAKERCVDGAWMLKVGKKAAGRLLDGREWNEYPQGPADG